MREPQRARHLPAASLNQRQASAEGIDGPEPPRTGDLSALRGSDLVGKPVPGDPIPGCLACSTNLYTENV